MKCEVVGVRPSAGEWFTGLSTTVKARAQDSLVRVGREGVEVSHAEATGDDDGKRPNEARGGW